MTLADTPRHYRSGPTALSVCLLLLNPLKPKEHWSQGNILEIQGGTRIQIQDGYGGRSLAEIASSGLGVFDLIPSYDQDCPICGGEHCAVRHGVYHRRVVDHGIIYDRFPVPRFRCRGRGQRERSAVTFSVLPEALLPRKQPSLPLVIWMLQRLLISAVSLSSLLDELAERFHRHSEPWLPEISTLYRLLRLFALARHRVIQLPASVLDAEIDNPALSPGSSAGGVDVGVIGNSGIGDGGVKPMALKMLALLEPSRGSPIVGRYHQARFPRLLFGPPRRSQCRPQRL